MTELTAIEPEPVAIDVIETLEAWLALAREGQLSSVAIAAVYRDGSSGDGHSFIHSIGTQIGAVAILQARLIAKVTRENQA